MNLIIDEQKLDYFLTRSRHIIDVRSPQEYHLDHIPKALNVPVLDDQERAEVGALHRINAFQARKRGAQSVTKAIQEFLKSPLILEASQKDAFLIYCARGGMRSASLCLILDQIGFPVFRLEKGYKTYRSFVSNILATPIPQPVFVLHGYTGSAKTRILQHLRDRINVLDLEAYASHRGSLFGNLPQCPQANQRQFETRIVEAYKAFDPKKPTLIEGESRKIGAVQVPGPIWEQMERGQHLWLEIPFSQRVAYILQEYKGLGDPCFLASKLKKLGQYLSKSQLEELRNAISRQDGPSFVTSILTYHYDPLYKRSLKRLQMELIDAFNFEDAVGKIHAKIRG